MRPAILTPGTRIKHVTLGLGTVLGIGNGGPICAFDADGRNRIGRQVFAGSRYTCSWDNIELAPRTAGDPPQRYGPYRPIARALP